MKPTHLLFVITVIFCGCNSGEQGEDNAGGQSEDKTSEQVQPTFEITRSAGALDLSQFDDPFEVTWSTGFEDQPIADNVKMSAAFQDTSEQKTPSEIYWNFQAKPEDEALVHLRSRSVQFLLDGVRVEVRTNISAADYDNGNTYTCWPTAAQTQQFMSAKLIEGTQFHLGNTG